ncbi:alpha/beta fold hydrolase [Comamonas sp. NLF-1-9]|uniref:alpha/beta hydrolase family protein n=1 Tax=Comamonas sp. NLF-1-9 TaxID=2853163 RepID=UPI001C46BAF3|nr:alpha/beta fold hydrolase [Comamonas sp. NLF-1-9]QXL83532.1 alpha/beta fold hydrolase [Comamonas sp. NLF-1-9]
MQAFTLTGSGAPVAVRRFDGAGAAHASVVIGNAVGVHQRYYQDFAVWLAAQGWRVYTFDWRGQGESLAGPMRDARPSMQDWVRDYEAVIAHARAQLPGRPLYLIGHSLGAQLPGLFSRPQDVGGLLAVAAGSGYWRVNAPQLRRRILPFWYLVMPAATWWAGYFPGARLGMVGDLPASIAWQWRRWCLHPRYAMGAEQAVESYARVRFPIHLLRMMDDEMMSEQANHDLLAMYPGAAQRVQSLGAQEAGGQRIGHLGFFKPRFETLLWPHADAVLRAWCGVAQTTEALAQQGHTRAP